MPTITVPDDTYERLSRRAARLGTTVEAVALPLLDTTPEPAAPAETLATTYDEWKRRFDEWQAEKEARYAAGDFTPPKDPGPSAEGLPPSERVKIIYDIAERARARADRYPPGFELDVSRESIYEGCGE